MTGRSGLSRFLYAGLYGPWIRQPVGRRSEPTEDAYSLFLSRSAALGWLTLAEEGASGGYWGTSDAEALPGSGDERVLAAKFLVAITGALPGGSSPVQPFLACIEDVVARLGALHLDAVQVLLPEPDWDKGQESSEQMYFSSRDDEIRSRALGR